MKAILVIDEMPKNCDECTYCGKLIEARKRGKLFVEERKRACLFVKNYIFYGFDVQSGRHECCPLKPMPEKLYVEANRIEDLMPSEFDMDKLTLKIQLDADKIFAFGWNTCLEEIERD